MIPFKADEMLNTIQYFTSLGPLNRYQQKWFHLLKCWGNVLVHSAGFSGQFIEFAKIYWLHLPQYCTGVWKNPPETFFQGVENYLQYLDQSWTEVMHSDIYGQKSAELLTSWLAFRKAIEAIAEDWQELSPMVSSKQMQELAERLQQMEQKLADISACGDCEQQAEAKA